MHRGKYAIIWKLKYAEICTKYAVTNMHLYTQKLHMQMKNMQNKCKIRNKHNMHLYADISYICYMLEYA